jgi:uncharacterized protein (DUF1330 family)
MSAYIVFTREKTLDRTELQIYWDKIKATFKGHPVKVLAAYGHHEVLEGDRVEGVVIAEFPSFETAKSWYNSAAYQEVRRHRLKGAIYRGLIVEGV